MASNKGEWAELYTALKLLAEGKLYLADRNGNKSINQYMELLELIRHETEARINRIDKISNSINTKPINFILRGGGTPSQVPFLENCSENPKNTTSPPLRRSIGIRN